MSVKRYDIGTFGGMSMELSSDGAYVRHDDYAALEARCAALAAENTGLAEAGNSPVIADGWVACSERMPPEYEPVYIFHPDYGVSQYVWYDHQEDAFVWDDETRFRELESVSHWMAMPAPPAAPEQEDK